MGVRVNPCVAVSDIARVLNEWMVANIEFASSVMVQINLNGRKAHHYDMINVAVFRNNART